MAHNLFISRSLKNNSPFTKALKGSRLTIIDESLVEFQSIPFSHIPSTDWLFFYSRNGVKFFFDGLQKHGINTQNLKEIKWATIGKGTATALKKYVPTIDFIGTSHPKSTAQEFLNLAAKQKVLFVRAKQSKMSVQKLLQGQLEMDDLVVYDNTIKKDFNLPNCQYLVFTSPLNATAYFQKYPLKKEQKVIAIGKTTEKALTNFGIPNIVTAIQPSEKALAKTVLNLLPHSPSLMTEKYAVIDLGTNTFHLLVAEKTVDLSFKELHRQRFFVKLAEEGIETIGDAPLARGFHALKTFRAILDELGVKKVKAIGTAALRTATNGPSFIQEVNQKYDIQIELIDGNREAELIYKGVRQAVPFQEKNYLIMDIGGGSVEFIIANKDEVFWAQSFPIGVAVLFKKFHQSEPIAAQEVVDLQAFLNDFLTPLYLALEEFKANTLVGASGTFDVLEYILAKDQQLDNHAFVQVADFEPLYQLLLKTTKDERFAMQSIPDTRADMIVVAVILIDFILRNANIEEIIVSNFALKEGILSELIN